MRNREMMDIKISCGVAIILGIVDICLFITLMVDISKWVKWYKFCEWNYKKRLFINNLN